MVKEPPSLPQLWEIAEKLDRTGGRPTVSRGAFIAPGVAKSPAISFMQINRVITRYSVKREAEALEPWNRRPCSRYTLIPGLYINQPRVQNSPRWHLLIKFRICSEGTTYRHLPGSRSDFELSECERDAIEIFIFFWEFTSVFRAERTYVRTVSLCIVR